MDRKSEKNERRSEPEMDIIPYDQSGIKIYDLDNIDKIYKDIIDVNEKIQILKTPSISGSPLEILNKEKRIYNLKNKGKYNKKTQILNIGNGDTFKGKVTIDSTEKNLSLKNGVYTWNSGETYVGGFNERNQFEGNGTLQKKGEDNSFSLASNFKDGFPGDKSIINIQKKNEFNLYIESDIKQEEKKGKIFLRLDGRTNITKTEDGKETYRFDGELKNGIIKNQASIKRKYKKMRDIDIYLTSKKKGDLINMEMEITTIKGDKNFYYKANYLNGLRIGDYIIQDEDNISYKREIKMKSELGKILSDLNTSLLTITGKECFEKLYRYDLDPLKLFNRLYKTKIDEEILVCHVNQRVINLIGFNSLCSSNFINLKELALNECALTDMSPLENANIPKLESLSLGRNKIVMINSINKLPFPKLQVIMLGYNKISEINALSKFHSTNLKTLALIDNNISDLTPLMKINTPNLEIISLGNNISNISILSKCNFPKLKQLGLQNNKIKDISCIKDFKFPNLEILYLSKNQISDISCLKNMIFPRLKILSLDNNKIKNIRPLLNIPNVRLSSLNIAHNKFRPYSSDNRTIIQNLGNFIDIIKI